MRGASVAKVQAIRVRVAWCWLLLVVAAFYPPAFAQGLPPTGAGTTHQITAFRYGTEGARPKAYLQAGLHADVALDLKVDPEILGGLIVRVGSRMIDSSLATKLNSLGTRLKG